MGIADDIEAAAEQLAEQVAALRATAARIRARETQAVNTLTVNHSPSTVTSMAMSDEKVAAIASGRIVGQPREDAIRLLLDETGMHSLSEVARAVGVSPAMISYVVAGTKTLGDEKAKVLESLKVRAASRVVKKR